MPLNIIGQIIRMYSPNHDSHWQWKPNHQKGQDNVNRSLGGLGLRMSPASFLGFGVSGTNSALTVSRLGWHG